MDCRWTRARHREPRSGSARERKRSKDQAGNAGGSAAGSSLGVFFVVRKIYQTTDYAIKSASLLFILGAFVLMGTPKMLIAQTNASSSGEASAATKVKKVKDQGEYEIYNEAIKDANNPQKEIQDLDTWTQKYPDSDYKDDRLYMYMVAYSKMNPPQPAKVLEYGKQLMDKGLDTVFPDKNSGINKLNVLYQVAWNVAATPTATPDQLALGEKAAKELLEFAPKYFTPENKPASTTPEQWAAARADIEKRAKTALGAIAMIPGNQAMAKNPKDCAAAEAAYTKALTEYPDLAAISYNLGTALACEARTQSDKATDLGPRAIYQFVRAAVIDPTLGGTADPRKIADYATSAYNTYHGSTDGLDQLKEQAKASAFPPAGFSIETASAVAARKEKEFTQNYPQYALWMGIKRQLTDTNGQQYFEGQLKDADVHGQNGRALKGILVEAKPACRSKELLIAISDPTKPGVAGIPEITLKLETPLTGKPVAGEIEFDGIPRAFTADPFMLTMETDKDKISGLKLEPCAAASRPVTKKRTVTKKR
jgi:hypothetical protein